MFTWVMEPCLIWKCLVYCAQRFSFIRLYGSGVELRSSREAHASLQFLKITALRPLLNSYRIVIPCQQSHVYMSYVPHSGCTVHIDLHIKNSLATSTNDLLHRDTLPVDATADIISSPHQSMFSQRTYPSGAVEHPDPLRVNCEPLLH